jgi:hypothetical protein
VSAIPQRLEESTQPFQPSVGASAPASSRAVVVAEGPAWQAFLALHWAFVVLPITVGADKFFGVLAPWRDYLAPVVPDVLGVSPQRFMYNVGVFEVLLGLFVAFAPRIGGWVMALWLWMIAANLMLIPGYADVALRDVGLSLGALALARLATQYEDAVEPPRRKR